MASLTASTGPRIISMVIYLRGRGRGEYRKERFKDFVFNF
jgi:hypothetical protein